MRKEFKRLVAFRTIRTYATWVCLYLVKPMQTHTPPVVDDERRKVSRRMRAYLSGHAEPTLGLRHLSVVRKGPEQPVIKSIVFEGRLYVGNSTPL